MIHVQNLWKRYGLPIRPTLRQFIHRLRGQEYDETQFGTWSLKDISFEAQKGETLGIIGHNGAGKSTLLKILAGVSLPTRGEVHLKGSLFPMIELNAGIHGELTGRENVLLLGSVMGFPRQVIREKMPQIEEFCELGEWFDKPAWQYSSGMLARLGFGVAMNVEADILLIDEVLAVGDLAFQSKCYDRLQELHRNGTSILLVSHNIRQIERLCDRAIWLDHGQLIGGGNPSQLAEQYYEQVNKQRITENSHAHVEGTGEFFIEQLEILSLNGDPIQSIEVGASFLVRYTIRTTIPLEKPSISLGFVSTDMIVVAGINNGLDENRPSFDGIGTLYCQIIDCPLVSGFYHLRSKVIDQNGKTLFIGHNLKTLEVVRSKKEKDKILPYTGFFRLNATWNRK